MNTLIQQALEKHGISPSIEVDPEATIVSLFEQAVAEFGPSPAFSSLGHTLSFTETYQYALQFASYLQQHTALEPGDRIAIQLPNLIQYPVALYGAMMAGMVVVNTNPLYTPRELEHQLNDSGAKAIVILANLGKTLESIVANTGVNTVIITELADLHPLGRRLYTNLGAKYLKKMVPSLTIPNAISYRKALSLGDTAAFKPAALEQKQLAILQYTGGTTGVAKGAMLSHRNLVSNVMQSLEMFSGFGLENAGETMISPLPLYHIYTFTMGMLLLVTGNHTVLIPNPKDTDALIADVKRYPMTAFCGINTLFVSLCNHPSFSDADFSTLKMTMSGGMALTGDAAKQWQTITGSDVFQGYGLTETSPVVSANPGSGNQVNTIGIAVPSTQIKMVDEQGQTVAVGERGELAVKGPQVMEGYWQRPEASAEVIDDEGWFYTGDIALMQDDGFMRIVDRKKDMIIVSGFNVYPNELEDVISQHPDVVECAAVGVPDDKTGEAIKIFAVLANPISEKELIAYCRDNLTAYKVPKHFEFRDDLPKSTVGKILRKDLR
ncbi:AMP-binding protein [Oceanicoccus sagamiensis]|uniref:Long-chain-fatty-acid--CoA ligase n=1 Tax=Oceanicoccus sagamiensis TaxID=716816 RepID=A0A1X9NDZ9_9GAMM|nr:AMP-binding protein [Oceanicoccus sagamiensis]ARN75284.1 long-chain fatty acid--CoA ligase [Oceanicoccus sagamiensis]